MQSPALVDGDEIFQYVRDLVEIGPRRTGTPEGKAAAVYVADRLRSFGIEDVRIDEVPSVRWVVTGSSLGVDGIEVDAFPVAHSGAVQGVLGPFGTGDNGITRRLIDFDRVTETDDVRGAIVLFDVHFPAIDVGAIVPPAERAEGTRWGEVYGALPDGKLVDPYNTTLADRVSAAVRAGAAGFIAVLADYFDSNRYLNEDYGVLTIPGMWVTRRQGELIRRRLVEQPEIDAALTLHGTVERVTGYAPVAVLPGLSSETILVHSHHDSAWDGAVQDASGTSVVLALAKHFASQPADDRQRTLMFATMDTHFTGYESHKTFVAEHVQTRQDGREILVDIATEHIARDSYVDGDDLVMLDTPAPRLLFTNAGAVLTDVIDAAVEDLSHLVVLPTTLLPDEELPSDADWTYRAGVTVISLISAPIFLYDECDSLDKVDRPQLGLVTSAFARMIAELMVMPRDAICDR